MSRPELWGGIECTVNRVSDTYFDQIARSGHARRPGDIELFAELGVRGLRFPVIWERTAPDRPGERRWRWSDDGLADLRRLGITPIVGLLHHGSGPRYTSLVDPAFPTLFASFAESVARRYPWVDAYTPINEPLTTARFSGLYGHWYPHGRDDRTFVQALMNQVRATVLAMRRIRRVNPAARLVQTDDLGRTYSTGRLAYQAEFENERKWLGWDLLCGRVGKEHPLYAYLRECGALEANLAELVEEACPPDVVGVNYYITSERFLDHRLARYPADVQGGNWRERYADVEAVRVCATGIAGHEGILREAWYRYGLPLALTELHLGCTRGEQLRWFHEGWSAACRLRAEKVDVRAVTAWSLLGSFDWDSLLTRSDGEYEPGVFDIRAPVPRETAVGTLMRSIAAGSGYDHPVLDTPGWWRRTDRWLYARARPAQAGTTIAPTVLTRHRRGPRGLLITGGSGTLGAAFGRICDRRGLSHRTTTRDQLDIADPVAVREMLSARPWAVINAAGYVRVDDAEREPERCHRENTLGAARLAEACAELGIPLVTFSSDLVFDGSRHTPYIETDHPSPLGVYGASKAEAERLVHEAHPRALVIRTSAFFGPWDEHNFLTMGLRAMVTGDAWQVDPVGVVSPTYVPDLVDAALDLLIDGESGIWHLANVGAVSWERFAWQTLRSAGWREARIEAMELDHPRAGRPAYSALGSRRGELLPPLEDAIRRYLAARPVGIPVETAVAAVAT